MREQAVASVARLQANLQAAQAKEETAALKLAEAKAAMAAAARALAHAEGVQSAEADKAMFPLQWDEAFFDKLGGLECTGEEGKSLGKLHGDLKAARSDLNNRSQQIHARLGQARQCQ
eukprot:4143671-Pyramimonas_sp.AAC.1